MKKKKIKTHITCIPCFVGSFIFRSESVGGFLLLLKNIIKQQMTINTGNVAHKIKGVLEEVSLITADIIAEKALHNENEYCAQSIKFHFIST